jgi:hypothetical protein
LFSPSSAGILCRMRDRHQRLSIRRIESIALAVAVLAAVGPAEVAGAQRTLPLASLRAGDTVRAWTHGPPIDRTIAVVASIGSDNLVLTDVPGRAPRIGVVHVPMEALTRIQVQRGSRSSTADAVVGFALGAAGGAVLGGLVGGAITCGGRSSYDSKCGGPGVLLLGGIPGAIAGALTGATSVACRARVGTRLPCHSHGAEPPTSFGSLATEFDVARRIPHTAFRRNRVAVGRFVAGAIDLRKGEACFCVVGRGFRRLPAVLGPS